MKKWAFYFYVVVLFLSSCKKDHNPSDGTCTGDCVNIEGKLIVQQTGIGLVGADLNFYFDKNSSGLGGNPQTIFLGTVKTQLDGNYVFSTPRSDFKSRNGRIVVKTNLLNFVNARINVDDVLKTINLNWRTDTIIPTNLLIWNASPLRIRVKSGTITTFDQFYFNQLFGYAFSNKNSSVTGRRNFDTTFLRLTGSNINTYINWSTQSLNSNTGSTILSGRDSIVVSSGSSGDMLIQLP